MLFATKIAHPNNSTFIFYLATRVREIDQSDWLNIVNMFKYIRDTKYLPLIIIAENIGIIKWYIDGSYTVHPNMRGHTGVGLTMGQGFII